MNQHFPLLSPFAIKEGGGKKKRATWAPPSILPAGPLSVSNEGGGEKKGKEGGKRYHNNNGG